MALITGSCLTDFLLLLLLIIPLMEWWQTYWNRKGLLTPRRVLFFGNGAGVILQRESHGDAIMKLYRYFKEHNKLHGGYYWVTLPLYMPVNLEIIKCIMQNDSDHFADRGVYIDKVGDPLSGHLFSLEGEKWRKLRAKLTPTFTSGKVKMMFDTVVKCSDDLILEMDKSVESSINIKDILARYTTDIIGNCAFGIECNSLKNPDNEFTRYLMKFFMRGFWKNIQGFFSFIAPNMARFCGVKEVEPDISRFFLKVVQDTVEFREKNNVYRKDFMHLLLQLKNRGKLVDDEKVLDDDNIKREVTLTTNELAAQAFVFFLGAFGTSSTTMAYCLFELASNPEIQERVRQEVNTVFTRYEGEFNYNGIMEMHYMERVINETLRKYPPHPGLNRICTKDYLVPGTDIVIEKGTKVMVPILGVQRDPEYYPDPEKFDPDRFTEVNKNKRHPFTFLPFGEGPRICIGVRFGMMQTKVGLSALLQSYKFSVSSKTKLPLKLDRRSFIMTTEGGIWLDYIKV
ncbi:unnamed protein product [Tenebrio molitor]|nr:unnamed protein product [Tenebrio molitor]